MTFENWDRYQYNLKNGYYHQFTRNVMQLNNGDGTFSELADANGVGNTLWSWGTKFSDFDLDGDEDLFIVNGYDFEQRGPEFNVYYRNLYAQGQMGFEDVSAAIG